MVIILNCFGCGEFSMLLDGNVHNELQGPPKIIHGLENENRNI